MQLVKDSNWGFTLAEVAIAVAILGVALTTLIGLQSRYMNNYIHERNLTQAALYAQYLMTMIEVAEEIPELGETDEPLYSELQENNYFSSDSQRDARQELEYWRVHTVVTPLELYEFPDVIRRIDLSVHWSERPEDSFALIYHVLNTEAREGQ